MTEDFINSINDLFLELEESQKEMVSSEKGYIYDMWAYNILRAIHRKIISDETFLKELYMENEPQLVESTTEKIKK